MTKRNIEYILIGIIILLLVLCVFLILSNNDDNTIRKIVCTKKDDSEYINTIKYDKTGKVISYQYTLITSFDSDKYEEFKKAEKQNKIDYKYDDKNKKVTQIEEPKVTVDKDNKEISTWYVTYVKSLEEQGYTCK